MTDKMNYEELLKQYKSLKDFDKINIVSEQGGIKVRIGFVITLFFNKGYTKEKRIAFAQIMRNYYDTFKDHLTDYVDSTTSKIKRIKDASFLDQYDENARKDPIDDPDTKYINHPDPNQFAPHLLGVIKGEKRSDPPFYYCGGNAFSITPRNLEDAVSYFDSYIPASWVEQHGFDALTTLVQHWCQLLKPMHGTAGLGTLFDPDTGGTYSGYIAFPLVKRFPGLDYNDTVTWRASIATRKETRVIRTTNWLSIIDDEFVHQLGGIDKIKAELRLDCPVHIYDGGIIIQAGPHAELGDVNYGIVLENYRTVARLLKSLRFENYKRGLFRIYDPFDPLEETKKWLARFD